MELVKVPLKLLTERVNKRLGKNYSPNHISQARNSRSGAASLQDVIRRVEAEILQEAAEQAQAA